MTESEIIDLIKKAEERKAETERVEFKDARGGFSGNSCWKTISSFSHSPYGGVIIFGAAERPDGTVDFVGVEDRARIQEAMVSYCREDMTGCLDPEFVDVTYKGNSLLAAVIKHIPEEMKPCHRTSLGIPNGACVRIGNVDKIITMDEAREFIRNSSPFKYDHLPALDTNFDDLSTDKLKAFLQKSARRKGRSEVSMSQVGALRSTVNNLGITTISDGQQVPTRAGYLIFSTQEPQEKLHFSRLIVRCIHYKGPTPSAPIIDKVDLSGTLDQQIDEMLAFVLKSIPLRAKIVGAKRVDKYEYPPDAIREIIANAIIHRDYTTVETYTQISVFSNRIEVTNAGNLPPGVTIDNIKDSQFSRNLVISSLLRDMDYLEEYGRGIDIVFSAMNDYGLMPPIFKNSSNTFKVILLGSAFKNLNSRQISIWHHLQSPNKTIAISDCLKMFQDVSRATLANDLSALVEIGLIDKIGSGPTTRYKAVF